MIWFTHCEIRLEITACKSRVSTSNLIKSNNWKNLSELHVRSNSDTRSISFQKSGRWKELFLDVTSVFGGGSRTHLRFWRWRQFMESKDGVWSKNLAKYCTSFLTNLDSSMDKDTKFLSNLLSISQRKRWAYDFKQKILQNLVCPQILHFHSCWPQKSYKSS